MKNYQRRAREKLDDIINALHHEVLKKERVLTVSFSLTKKDSIQNTVIYHGAKEALNTAIALKEILEGKTEVNRIITITSYIDDILLKLQLSKEEIKDLFLDLVATDYLYCVKKVKLNSIVLSLPSKIFLQQHNIRIETILPFLDDNLLKIYEYYPKIADELIQIIKSSRNDLLEIFKKLENIKKIYFAANRKLTPETYSLLIEELKKLGLNNDFYILLVEELKKDITVEQVKESDSIENKENENRKEKVSEKELIKPKRISEEEKARLEEFRSLFNLKLGEAKHPLTVEEQEKLLNGLIYYGYDNIQCRNILAETRRRMPCLEKFHSMDLIDKIKLAITLRKTYHTNQEILAILENIDNSDKDNPIKQSTKEQTLRNVRILKLIVSYMDKKSVHYQILNQAWDMIKQIPENSKENWQKERNEWKDFIQELLQEAYIEMKQTIVLEESKIEDKYRKKEII